MCETNGGVGAGIWCDEKGGVAGVGAKCPGAGDPPTGGERRARGSLDSCYYITQELGHEKVGEGEGNSLFAVGMRGGARWNVAVQKDDARHVLRKHRDFVPSVGTVGEMRRD